MLTTIIEGTKQMRKINENKKKKKGEPAWGWGYVVKRGWVLDPEKISFRPKNREIPLVLYKPNLLIVYYSV